MSGALIQIAPSRLDRWKGEAEMSHAWPAPTLKGTVRTRTPCGSEPSTGRCGSALRRAHRLRA